MNRRQVRGWLAFALPLFMLRSLIPVGFMPMVAADHRLQLALCDSYAPMPAMAAPASMDMSDGMPMDGMDMSQAHHADETSREGKGLPSRQDHGGCLYGSSPALGAPLAVAVGALTGERSATLALSFAQVSYFGLSSRSQSARGPPA